MAAAYDTLGNIWMNPPRIVRTVRAKVTKATNINGSPVKVGTIVEVDEHTFRNLARKERLEAVEEKKPEEKKPEEKKPEGDK